MPAWPRILGSSSSSSSSNTPPRGQLLDSTDAASRSGTRMSPHSRSRSHHVPLNRSPGPAMRRSDGDLLGTAEAEAGRNMGDMGTSRRNGPGGMPASAELKTGQCMCCDSTIRWPSNLPNFRCTICMTINDLTPAKPAVASPISLDTVRTIIETSKMDFLADQELQNPPVTAEDSSRSPPAFEASERAKEERVGGGRPSKPGSVLDDFPPPPSRPPPPPPPLDGADLRKPHIPESRAGYPAAVWAKRHATKLFQPLESYLKATFGNCECLNASFVDRNGTEPTGPATEEIIPPIKATVEVDIPVTQTPCEKETLMLTVGRAVRRERANSRNERGSKTHESRPILRAPPCIDWDQAREFYELVLNTGNDALAMMPASNELRDELQYAIDEARVDMLKTLLRTTENILKRPGRPLKRLEDTRFLLVIIANPLLYPGAARFGSSRPPPAPISSQTQPASRVPPNSAQRRASQAGKDAIMGGPSYHSGILKRLFGLLSNLPNECHHFLITWFSVMPARHFRRLVELGGSFTTYRISRQDTKKPVQRSYSLRGKLPYSDDWQIKATARVMSLLEKANNNSLGRRKHNRNLSLAEVADIANMWRHDINRRGLIIPSNSFYNMRVDYCDLIADFDAWESKLAKFCFCQYPFFLSMGAKIQILEHDARRQMEVQARNAFITNISNRTTISQYMVLKVRRDCLVEDSLKGISESAGTIDDLKKGLKVEFVGEDGIDAGGLKKEWFLMVAREVFDPNHGLFLYEEEASCSYFNPHTFESSEEFYLVGVLLGLAIYNSTILDVTLPPYVFRKLIYFAPQYGKSAVDTRARLTFRRSLEDLAPIRPALAVGLQQLLDFEGDVQETFCRDFVAETEKYGEKIVTPLCPGGGNRPVTNANRKEFVDLYLKHILDTSVSRQFEPFKRGFYTVCGGNALSLFGPEEIELLVRGSGEALDVQALKAVAIYDGWGASNPPESDTVVRWFWGFFEKLSPLEQRKLLSFITGSDRIPAMGATNLIIKVVCLGQDSERFPVARTCFNQICLWRYRNRAKFERLLWRAVTESEGFGLK
ncbi:putative ubiquitin-protein ligase [Tricharina praecox]|uniref:putative ubiquitin-protein ligase n=1 Tax=Tricharina praecox TaxID=43433 RepID=UPI00222100BA|nr:putative ubiquitin-protein ligase [Tricharina praecox]KAI5855906.1 putative ubiquitin-protein ligase [Tricharina praecox]